jgi:hypothetical protein
MFEIYFYSHEQVRFASLDSQFKINLLRFDIQILLISLNIILIYGSQTYLTETKIIISLENSCLSFCLWSFGLAVLKRYCDEKFKG